MGKIDLKKLIKELDDEWYYLALYVNGKRIYGDFCYQKDTTLKEYLNWEVIDITPSENSKIIKVELKECIKEETVVSEPKLEKKEETKDGKKRRNSTSRKSSKIL